MLCLTRKVGQTIEIGGGITIAVIRVQGEAVRLGISAPADVPIVRSEAGNREPRDRSRFEMDMI